MAGLVVVEGAVLVKQVVFGEQARVEVAVAQVEGGDMLVVDVLQLLARGLAERVLEDEEGAGGEDYGAAGEGGVPAGFAEEDT